MNRVILINKTKSPSREELVSSERRTGEILFARFPELVWAGFIVPSDYGRRSANWIIPAESYDSFKVFAQNVTLEGYELALYTNGSTRFGGQTEVRAV